MTCIRNLLALVVLGSVTVACSASAAAPPTTTAPVAATVEATTTTVASTTTLEVTTTTTAGVPPLYRAKVETCLAAVPVDLAAQAATDPTVVDTAYDACLGATGTGIKDAATTFVTALAYAQVSLKTDHYSQTAQDALFTSVLDFQEAADKYLG